MLNFKVLSFEDFINLNYVFIAFARVILLDEMWEKKLASDLSQLDELNQFGLFIEAIGKDKRLLLI